MLQYRMMTQYFIKKICYYLTLYNIPSKECHCFIWHEGPSKRGSNDIADCTFIGTTKENRAENIWWINQVKEEHGFTYGCSWPNTNSILRMMMLYTEWNRMNFEQIHLRCFQSLHGQSEGAYVYITIQHAVKLSGIKFVSWQLAPNLRLPRNLKQATTTWLEILFISKYVKLFNRWNFKLFFYLKL